MSNYIHQKKKGIILLMVLAMLLVVVILAAIVLNIISSQSRLTKHQVNRIQAYYAAQAGINLALEKLRTGAWTTTTPGNPYSLCASGCSVNDTDMPYRVDINIGAPGANNLRQISTTVTYTYTTP